MKKKKKKIQFGIIQQKNSSHANLFLYSIINIKKGVFWEKKD